MSVRGFLWAAITDQMNCIAGFTLLEMMVAYEQIPVRPLVWHDYSRSFAERTDAVQGGNYCRADELGPIGDPFHRFSQRFRDLERDDVQLFSFHRQVLQTWIDFELGYYYLVTPICQANLPW